ncbi:hypothetical protein RRG08_016142 [Elysia crispata]|uniref:Uncharacterized protein n=1 Tax=Elysia crispata TaxID=231223 RepID=A0AAE0Z345_9GAST|nr:hypothetical protein RRG08_016142 [Elysia crispata]
MTSFLTVPDLPPAELTGTHHVFQVIRAGAMRITQILWVGALLSCLISLSGTSQTGHCWGYSARVTITALAIVTQADYVCTFSATCSVHHNCSMVSVSVHGHCLGQSGVSHFHILYSYAVYSWSPLHSVFYVVRSYCCACVLTRCACLESRINTSDSQLVFSIAAVICHLTGLARNSPDRRISSELTTSRSNPNILQRNSGTTIEACFVQLGQTHGSCLLLLTACCGFLISELYQRVTYSVHIHCTPPQTGFQSAGFGQ